MRVTAVTYGTEGDARPLAALCRALIDAGHDARLLADEATLSTARALGVPASPLSGDILAALKPGGAMSGAIGRGGGFGDTAAALARVANANCQAWMAEVLAAAEGSDGLLVCGLAAFVGFSVAERLGVPAIGAGLIPITPTAAFPSPFLPPGLTPRWLNRASFTLVNDVLWRSFREAVNEARRTVCGLPPRERVWTDHPMLYGLSPGLIPRPGDWPANVHVCGQWTVAASDWAPPPALEAFLHAGSPPVYVGFGSMAGFEPRAMLNEIIAGLKGRRAVFYAGWSGAETVDLPASVLAIGDTPHDWLFPRVSAVVHHGGSGTSHSAARAGRPSVVIPFAGDQFFWADRLRAAGVAPPRLHGRRLRADALARGLDLAGTAAMVGRAAALGDLIVQEDGPGRGVALLASLLA